MSKKDSILKNSAVAFPLAFFCQVLWGIVFPIIKKAYALFSIQSVADTFLFASIRFIIAGIILLAFATIRDKRFPILRKGTRLPVFLLGTVQTGIVYGFQFAALTRAASINCSIINGMACIFSVLSARILFPSERITPKKTIGILLGFSAILFCFLYKGEGVSSVSFLGEGLMVISVFLFNFAASYSKKVTTGVDSMVTAGYNLFIGGVELLVLALLLGGGLGQGGILGYSLLLFLAFVSSFCLLSWTALLSANGVARIAIFWGCNPIAGAIASALILGENVFQLKYIVAVLLVAFSIVVLNVEPKKKH